MSVTAEWKTKPKMCKWKCMRVKHSKLEHTFRKWGRSVGGWTGDNDKYSLRRECLCWTSIKKIKVKMTKKDENCYGMGWYRNNAKETSCTYSWTLWLKRFSLKNHMLKRKVRKAKRINKQKYENKKSKLI